MSGRKVFLPPKTLDKCTVCGRKDLKLRWCMSCAEVGLSRSASALLNFNSFAGPLLLNPMPDKGLESTQGQMW